MGVENAIQSVPNLQVGRTALVTTDSWFYAPDGKIYRAVFGTVRGVHESQSTLGVRTNSRSTNWYLDIGNMTIAGCQIHYVVSCDKVNLDVVEESSVDAGKVSNYERPSAIYDADQKPKPLVSIEETRRPWSIDDSRLPLDDKPRKLKTKSALSYFGSDSEVAEDLAALLNHCKHVTIPFCGGMSILPHLKARAIVANDLHGQVINFYRYLSGSYGTSKQEELIKRCRATLSHPDELRIARDYCDDNPINNDTLHQAWAFWATCWIGRKGKGGTKYHGGLPSVRRTPEGGTNATRIRAAASDLGEWCKHFERCEWESIDFRQLLGKVADIPACGIYCDPPWIGAGRDYQHTFSDQDHVELASLLARFENATVVVRYGDHRTIRELYSDSRWRIIESASRDQCNAVKGELWITNQAEKP